MEKGFEPSKIPEQSIPAIDRLTQILRDLSTHQPVSDLQLIELKEGQILISQGDAGDTMYLVHSGSLGVRVRHNDGRDSIINKLSPGEVVGEMALLSGQPRSATVFALEDTDVICLPKSTFDQLIEADLSVAEGLVA